MASHLDLEEQEQLAQLRHFWKTYGNLITWLLVLVLGSYAAWNAWQYWERHQAVKAASLYDEFEKALQTKDVARVERAMTDMKDRFAGTQLAYHAALLTARVLSEEGKASQAIDWLVWAVNKSPNAASKDLARLRLAALQWDAGSADEALKTLQADFGSEAAPLAADLKGDLMAAKGSSAEAVSAYRAAYTGLAGASEYRRIVQSKLNALGVDISEVKP